MFSKQRKLVQSQAVTRPHKGASGLHLGLDLHQASGPVPEAE